MKTEKFTADTERQIVTAMLLDSAVLNKISTKWVQEGLFRSRWANTVGSWAVDFYLKYQDAPKGNIEGIFRNWAETNKDEATVTLVDNFLADLSGEYETGNEEINAEYVVDTAAVYFNEVAVERLTTGLQGCLTHGSVDRAFELVSKFCKVELGVGTGIKLLQDKEEIQNAFEASTEPLIRFSGDLDKFMGNQFGRDEFVAILGATGRGKTWWLMELAWQAVRQNKRVAFFEVGDMSKGQAIKRFMVRASGIPLYGPKQVQVPVAIYKEGDSVRVETQTKAFETGLDWNDAWKACEERNRRHKKPLLNLSVHPAGSINVAGIVGVLDSWEREGWVPDIIVIDYADILAPPVGFKERDAINKTWEQLRALSQSKHVLVLTATQSDAASYNVSVMRRNNFSDDRRKLDHVTGMLGINASEEEKQMGVTKLNWIKRREAEYNESQCCYVAGCLEIGRPCMCSVF